MWSSSTNRRAGDRQELRTEPHAGPPKSNAPSSRLGSSASAALPRTRLMQHGARALARQAAGRSQRRTVALPLPLQLVHERDEAWIVPDVVEVRVPREVGVAGPAGLRRPLQPVDGPARLVKQGVYRRDVVGGVMKVDEALSFRYGRADVRFGPPGVAGFGEQDGPRAGHDTAAVLRVLPQVSLHERGRFRIPAEIEERPGDLVIPERLIGLGWHLPDQA